MRWSSLIVCAAIAVFSVACEQHPLPGDPHPAAHGDHAAESSGSHHAPAPADPEKRDAAAPQAVEAEKTAPAEAKAEGEAKPETKTEGEAPKFFPKPEEKK